MTEEIMTYNEVEDKAKELIAKKLGVGEGEINPETGFVEDLGADSLDLIELIMDLEIELDLNVTDEDAEGLINFEALMDYITSKVPVKESVP